MSDNTVLPKVLIVEDLEVVVKLYKLLLSNRAALYTVATVAEAELALSEHNDFALISWDYSLPDGNTLELIEATRARYPELPMLAVSSDPIHRGHQLYAGCDLYCVKEDVPLFVDMLLYPVRDGAMAN
jgi:CheY-like chemotaxis protein